MHVFEAPRSASEDCDSRIHTVLAGLDRTRESDVEAENEPRSGSYRGTFVATDMAATPGNATLHGARARRPQRRQQCAARRSLL